MECNSHGVWVCWVVKFMNENLNSNGSKVSCIFSAALQQKRPGMMKVVAPEELGLARSLEL